MSWPRFKLLIKCLATHPVNVVRAYLMVRGKSVRYAGIRNGSEWYVCEPIITNKRIAPSSFKG